MMEYIDKAWYENNIISGTFLMKYEACMLYYLHDENHYNVYLPTFSLCFFSSSFFPKND